MASGEGFDLKQFLEQQRTDGVVESQGSAFTVAADKALSKLGQFALPHPYDWVLKVVQAVTLWEAEVLMVRQTRAATSFTFVPGNGRPIPDETELIQALSRTSLANDEPAQVLAMALRSLVVQARLSFVLALRREDQVGEPIFAGDVTSQLDPATRKRWTALSQDGVRLTVSHFRAEEALSGRYLPILSKTERRDLLISGRLEGYAFASRMPIYLDGRLINDPPQQARLGATGSFRTLLTGTVGVSAGPRSETMGVTPAPPLARSSSFHAPVIHHKEGLVFFLVKTMEWRELQRFYSVADRRRLPEPRAKRGMHKVFLTRHGVIVEELSLRNTTLGTSVYLFVNADNFRSDLVGLSVEVGDAERRYLRVVQRIAAGAVAQFMHGFPDLCARAELASPPPPAGLYIATEGQAAGFSVLTESLLSPFKRLARGLGVALEMVDNVVHHQQLQGSFFGPWRTLVWRDLGNVATDLRTSDPQGPSGV